LTGRHSAKLIGVISDTHGLLRPEAVEALKGVELILHAGDIGKPEVLTELEKIAPVVAIRGNNDRDAWALEVPEVRDVEIGGLAFHILHDLKQLAVDPSWYDVIVAGHSHKPKIEEKDGVLYLNPGSSGRRRFKLPVTVARLKINDGRPEAAIIELAV
jgi:putative phosphoesterase